MLNIIFIWKLGFNFNIQHPERIGAKHSELLRFKLKQMLFQTTYRTTQNIQMMLNAVKWVIEFCIVEQMDPVT